MRGLSKIKHHCFSLQAVFEGVVESSNGDLAIDDVLLLDQACPHPDSCDFELDFCDWHNEQSTDDFDWIRFSGQTQMAPNTGPDVGDHTLNGTGIVRSLCNH